MERERERERKEGRKECINKVNTKPHLEPTLANYMNRTGPYPPTFLQLLRDAILTHQDKENVTDIATLGSYSHTKVHTFHLLSEQSPVHQEDQNEAMSAERKQSRQ